MRDVRDRKDKFLFKERRDRELLRPHHHVDAGFVLVDRQAVGFGLGLHEGEGDLDVVFVGHGFEAVGTGHRRLNVNFGVKPRKVHHLRHARQFIAHRDGRVREKRAEVGEVLGREFARKMIGPTGKFKCVQNVHESEIPFFFGRGTHDTP